MSRHLQLVFTDPTPGREDEFNDWYDRVHLDEVVANLPGFVSGRRYRLHPSQREGAPACPWHYLALYELDTDDLAGTNAATEAFRDAGGFTPHRGAIAPGHQAWIYTESGPLVRERDVPTEGKLPLGAGQHLFLAFTNPADGRDADFDRWYETHVPEVVGRFSGLTSGQLFDRSAIQRDGMTAPWLRLALYDLRADDLDAYHRLDRAVREGGALTPHDGALDPSYAVWVFTETSAAADA